MSLSLSGIAMSLSCIFLYRTPRALRPLTVLLLLALTPLHLPTLLG